MQYTHIVVHHTGAEEKDAEQVKQYHLSLGWRDIGYNYVIERSGNIVNGRPPGIPGAHCRAQGMNRCSLGVAVLGNMDKHQLLPAQHQGLVTLLQKLARRHDIPAENILGHREVPGTATACPGRFTDMQALRSGLAHGTLPDGSANRIGDIPRRGVSPFLNQEDDGTVPVAPTPKTPDVLWRVQVGAFRARKNAEAYAQSLKQKGVNAFVVRNKGG
ncbi:MAG: N-acetylmuramoyl-L-alanine amidase [Firmicutes bacterium]|nr:N-acetylmuramoyl-L-alanine amidase [Bacillota bacterium]